MVVYYKVGNGEVRIPEENLESLLEEVFRRNLERFGYYPKAYFVIREDFMKDLLKGTGEFFANLYKIIEFSNGDIYLYYRIEKKRKKFSMPVHVHKGENISEYPYGLHIVVKKGIQKISQDIVGINEEEIEVFYTADSKEGLKKIKTRISILR